MKNYFLLPLLSLLTGCFTNVSQDNRLGYNKAPIQTSDVTSDIDFIGQTQGQGSRYELFGIFKWGDSGRADYEGQYVDSVIGNNDLIRSRQAAVYNAIGDQKGSYLIDPQFTTTEKDFIIFKSFKSDVVGQHAKKSNYRQIKRYTTDRSDTTLLPYSYSVNRNGVEVTSISASRDIPPHVTDTINLVESQSGNTLHLHRNSSYTDYPNYNNKYQSIDDLVSKHQKKLEEFKTNYQAKY